MSKQPCIYILARRPYGTLYVGVTANLIRRLYQHRGDHAPGFTDRYGVHRLVRYEFFADLPGAIAREKQLKRSRRDWKINLIESDNPHWADLAVELGLSPLAPVSGPTMDAETSSA